jgi:hypothetical protein
MMMGYYDINGYGSLSYENLVAGGAASSYYPGDTNVRDTIASEGHIYYFYTGGYGASGFTLTGGDELEISPAPEPPIIILLFMGVAGLSVVKHSGRKGGCVKI